MEDRVKDLSVLLELPDLLRNRVATTLLRVSTFSNLDSGTALYKEGDRSTDDGYVLLNGDVAINRSDGFATTLQAPAILGEMQQFHLANNACRIATVIAGRDVSVLHFAWDDLYNTLAGELTHDELNLVRDVLRSQAWMHYLEIDDEI
jgi:hypothetical protein